MASTKTKEKIKSSHLHISLQQCMAFLTLVNLAVTSSLKTYIIYLQSFVFASSASFCKLLNWGHSQGPLDYFGLLMW
jgi:hypothetical protein